MLLMYKIGMLFDLYLVTCANDNIWLIGDFLFLPSSKMSKFIKRPI
jgi:hypothetical protein